MSDKVWVLHLIARRKENKGKVTGHKGNKVYQKIVKSKFISELSSDMEQLLLKAKLKTENYDNLVWRFYISVDSRNVEKANRLLINKILDDKFDNNKNTNISSAYMSLLMKKECRNERYFLIDIDALDGTYDKVNDLMVKHDIHYVYDGLDSRTPNGYHIICQGFNPSLLKDIPNVEIKTNALRFLKMVL